MPIVGAWINLAVARCNGKFSFKSIELAEKVARKDSIKTGDLVIAYQCYDCGSFHVGHADESQKIVRRPVEPPSLPVLCPRCRSLISAERRKQAMLSGSPTVYCSAKCKEKWSRRKRHNRKYGSRAAIHFNFN